MALQPSNSGQHWPEVIGNVGAEGAGWKITPVDYFYPTVKDEDLNFLDYSPGDDYAAKGGTFSRGGAYGPSYFDQTGLMKFLPIGNALRDNHWIDGIRTTLIEAARTNGWAEAISYTGWTLTGCSLGTPTTAPDGTASMKLILEDISVGSGHGPSHATPSFTAGAPQSFSLFVKAYGTNRPYIRRYLVNGGDRAGIDFNLSTGVLSDFVTGLGAVKTKSARYYPLFGIWRIECTVVLNPTSTIGSVVNQMAPSLGNTGYLGDGVSGMYMWGEQFEVDSTCCSSFILTAGASLTRAIELFTFPWIGGDPQAVSVLVKGTDLGTGLIGTFDATAVAGIIALGGSGVGFESLFLTIDNTSNHFYRAYHRQSADRFVTSAVAGNVGQRIEARMVADLDGSVILGIDKFDGIGEQIIGPSAALAFKDTLEADNIYIGRRTAVGSAGLFAFERIYIAPRKQTMTYLRNPVTPRYEGAFLDLTGGGMFQLTDIRSGYPAYVQEMKMYRLGGNYFTTL